MASNQQRERISGSNCFQSNILMTRITYNDDDDNDHDGDGVPL